MSRKKSHPRKVGFFIARLPATNQITCFKTREQVTLWSVAKAYWSPQELRCINLHHRPKAMPARKISTIHQCHLESHQIWWWCPEGPQQRRIGWGDMGRLQKGYLLPLSELQILRGAWKLLQMDLVDLQGGTSKRLPKTLNIWSEMSLHSGFNVQWREEATLAVKLIISWCTSFNITKKVHQ